ncbi:MAG: universal stress protein [Actinomycetota bacterium]|nr:universal stress protein [Actinomycetota bacterium]
MIQKILVGTNVSTEDGDAALHRAADLARAHGAELVVVGLTQAPDPRQLFDAEMLPEPQDQVHLIRSRFPELRARGVTASGRPMDAMVDVAKDERPDLIYVGNLLRDGDADGAADVHTGAPATAPLVAHEAAVGTPAGGVRRQWHGAMEPFRRFYSQGDAWLALLVSSLFLTYGGGAVMFWLHALHRGERGPAVNDWYHWALDSTLGFVALTPVLFFILPAVLLARGSGSHSGRRYRRWFPVVLVGGLFTLVTGPGPMLHNAIAGAGTPLADWAVRLFGHNAEVAERSMHAIEHSPVTEGLLQVAVGLPVYTTLTWLALRLLAAMTRRRDRSTVTPQ